MSLKCTLIWMERGLININGRALFALKTCHLAFMSTDKGRTAPILRRMRESFMKARLLCHIYLLSSSTRHGISVVFIFFFMKAWLLPLLYFLGAIFGGKLSIIYVELFVINLLPLVFLKCMKWTFAN